MVVTRSATRTACQLTRSRITKKKNAKSKATKSSATKAKTDKELATKRTCPKAKAIDANYRQNRTAPYRERLIEWITLRDPIDGIITNKSEVFSLLQQLRKQKGCQVVARARPSELQGIEWLTIEWQDLATRDIFLGSELSERLMQALAPRCPTKEMVWPIDCWEYHRVIRADPRYPPPKLYEILTVYIPAKLDEITVKKLENLAPECSWPEDLVPNPGGKFHDDKEASPDLTLWTGEKLDLIMDKGERTLSDENLEKNPHIQGPPGPIGHETTKPEVDESGMQGKYDVRGSFKNPMKGFLYHERAWMEGEVEYRGQPARRLITILRFENEEGEQCYKQENERDSLLRKRAIVNEMENFFADLEDLGMLGYESHHARFLEVLDRVPEDAVFFPGQFPMKRLPWFLIETSIDL